MSETIFTKIINGDIPGHFIYEDDTCVAILDAFPAVRGQSLVIPKQPEPYVFALPEDVYQHLFLVAKRISTVLDTELDTVRTCLVVEGFEVPHTHIKLYPMREETPLGAIMQQQTEANQAELATLAQTLKTQLG
ncbi:MAG TPA: HIT family protein [Candidatus Paceibacterota bacterium]|nr:HIT family protein [Candidatus Paceibacterota bacterium]